METVRITVEDNELSIAPQGYVRDFDAYLGACRAAGCSYRAADKTNRASFDNMGHIMREFQRREFLMVPSLEVILALEGRADSIERYEERAAKLIDERGLYPFQAQGVAFLRSRSAALLMDDMGLGKTIQALVAIEDPKTAVLVVCPAVVKGNWAKEIVKWTKFAPIVCAGKKSFAWPLPGQVVIVNPEILPSDTFAPKTQVVAIVDEAHMYKNSKSQRTERLRAMLKFAHTKWLLTGTPLMNKPPELWNVLQLAGLGAEAYGTWKGFAAAFGGFPGRFGYEWGKPNEAAARGLSKVALRRTKKQVLPQLPTKRFRTVGCELTQKQTRSIDACEVVVDNPEDLAAMPRIAGMSAARLLLADAKLKTALKLIEEYEQADEPVVVFCEHKNPIKELGTRKGWACIHGDVGVGPREDIICRFQAGEFKGLALTIGAGYQGITLTRAAHMMFIDRTFVPAKNDQAEDRICRIGQERGCIYTFLVAAHELDANLAAILEDKRTLIDETIERTMPQSGLANELRSIAHMMREAGRHNDCANNHFEVDTEPSSDTKFRGPEGDVEQWACDALLRLSAADTDNATLQNGVGFNSRDTGFGNSLADRLRSTDLLSDKQWAFAIEICTKYRGQIGERPCPAN